jgi:hypothetical protein
MENGRSDKVVAVTAEVKRSQTEGLARGLLRFLALSWFIAKFAPRLRVEGG